MTKERPILFSGPMVQAILDGRKTQTRRVVKDLPDDTTDIRWVQDHEIVPHGTYTGWTVKCGAPLLLPRKCPYGVPGDRRACGAINRGGDLLWVKESYRLPVIADLDPPSNFRPGTPLWYEADGQPDQSVWGRLRPSIHMPRWAERITLEVVKVRVERVEDITEADAIAEGFDPMRVIGNTCRGKEARERFLHTFYDLNKRAQRGSNPWVWVVEFKTIEVRR